MKLSDIRDTENKAKEIVQRIVSSSKYMFLYCRVKNVSQTFRPKGSFEKEPVICHFSLALSVDGQYFAHCLMKFTSENYHKGNISLTKTKVTYFFHFLGVSNTLTLNITRKLVPGAVEVMLRVARSCRPYLGTICFPII